MTSISERSVKAEKKLIQEYENKHILSQTTPMQGKKLFLSFTQWIHLNLLRNPWARGSRWKCFSCNNNSKSSSFHFAPGWARLPPFIFDRHMLHVPALKLEALFFQIEALIFPKTLSSLALLMLSVLEEKS